MSALTPDQEARIRALLIHELRTAWDAALEDGASEAELAESVEHRRRVLESEAALAGEPDQPLVDAADDHRGGHSG